MDYAAGEFASVGIASNPTLPRTKPMRCAGEAVFFHHGGQLRIPSTNEEEMHFIQKKRGDAFLVRAGLMMGRKPAVSDVEDKETRREKCVRVW